MEMIDQACAMCANDNLELACAFIQKTAIEKAIIEIEKCLKNVSIFFTYFILKMYLYTMIIFLF